MKLSIVITCLEDPDIYNTLHSIRETAGDRPEVIVVSDSSSFQFQDNTKGYDSLFLNAYRCGVGPSRTVGVQHATGDHVMIIDSHMRFKPGWYEEVMRRVDGREKTIHCAVCAGLDSQNMDVNNPKGRYYGAKLEIFGPDPNRPGAFRVFEGTWNKTPPEDDAELSCLMGACYVMPRKWFLHLDALRFLRSWGGDEQMLSIKSWMAGGDVRLMRNVEIGHVFLRGEEKQPYKTPVGHIAHNKFFALYTLLTDDERAKTRMLEHMMTVYGGGEFSTGMKIIAENYHLLTTEIARNHSIFKHTFQWYADRHGIALNGKK